MGLTFKLALLFGVYAIALSAAPDVFIDPTGNQCLSNNLSGVDYILSVRGRDYGWKVHTHRANIALGVDGYKAETADEMIKMELQLEEEIIKALLKNQTNLTNENDLAMFIHALIATKRNPWDFHGLNLVGDLLHRVNVQVKNQVNVHPFLVLALCNSHAVEEIHLDRIKKHLESRGMNPEDVANKAIALKAYSCAASLPYATNLTLDLESNSEFKRAMDTAHKFLVNDVEDEGKFGNVYTTSLVVQALTAMQQIYERHHYSVVWPEERALDYLRKESNINVNLLQAYYIVLALNARKVRCIKDLYGGVIGRPVPKGPSYFTTYSIMDEQNPDVYFTVYMRIPKDTNFFHVMEKARDLSSNFNFSYVYDRNAQPSVYEAVGKPNDAEQNFFWTICRQSNVNHDPHSSRMETLSSSPVNIIVEEREHFTLWYRSSSCPPS